MAAELLQIHRDSYGRGARSARVYQLGDAVVCILDEIELLPNEEFLIGEGHGSTVVEVRGRHQQAVETTFRAAVERATGRQVTSFVSATKLSPAWTVESSGWGRDARSRSRSLRMSEHTTVTAEHRSQSPAALISNRMVRLMANYVGRGPTKARTTLNTKIVLVVFADTMTRAEQNLTAAGQADAVRSMRQTLHGSMRGEAVAAVEEITGRRVLAYMGDIDTDANMAAVGFTFEPRPESGIVEVAEAGER